MKIFKYSLQTSFDLQLVKMPQSSRILSAGVQGQFVVVWAEVDPDKPPINFLLQVVPTGGEAPLDARFLNTVFLNGLVFHVYEVAG